MFRVPSVLREFTMLFPTTFQGAAVLCALALVLYLMIRGAKSRNFSASRVVGPVSPSWVTGHLKLLFNAKGLPYHLGLIDTYGDIVKIKGFFGDNQLYVADPLALHNIIIKEQDIFEETSVFIENNKIIFGEGLVATIGDHHRRQRKLINPVFSVPQIRSLVPIFYSVARRLNSILVRDLERNKGSTTLAMDMSQWMSRVALESIGQAGLGYSFDPLDSPSNNLYTETVRQLIPTLFQLSVLRQFVPFATRLGPAKLRRFLLNFVPVRAVHKVKQMSDIIYATSKNILDQKRKAWQPGDDRTDSGKDIMSVLLNTNEVAASADRLSDDELTGQMSVLIFGAQDTTSSAMTRILHELSLHGDIQDRVRFEILSALENSNDGQLSYEELSSLPLLDGVVKETLRLHPPVPFVRRCTRKDTNLPLSKPIRLEDGQIVDHLEIPEGTTIFAGIAAVNRSQAIWGSDASAWRPERWLTDLPEGVKAAHLPTIYPGMLTFLGGGRACIGYRFALTEMKVILSNLLASFTFTLTDDEVVWNLAQIVSPSVVNKTSDGIPTEKQGLPLKVCFSSNGL